MVMGRRNKHMNVKALLRSITSAYNAGASEPVESKGWMRAKHPRLRRPKRDE